MIVRGSSAGVKKSRFRIPFRQRIQTTYDGWLIVVENLVERPSLLVDIGLGKGSAAKLFKSVSGRTIQGTYIVGLDIFLPYLKSALSERHRIFDDVILADARNLPLRKGCMDVVLCTEVIEHLTKDEGKKLVESLEALARHQVILTTPNFDLEQGIIDDNPYMIHKSLWTDSFFRRRGYRVFGIRGLRRWPHPKSRTALTFAYAVGLIVAVIWQPIIKTKTSISEGLLCIKDLRFVPNGVEASREGPNYDANDMEELKRVRLTKMRSKPWRVRDQ